MTELCKHGAGAKCTHCLYVNTISDVAHDPFDHFLKSNETQNSNTKNL